MTQHLRELDASKGPQFVSSTHSRPTGSNTLFWITPVPTHSWHRLTQTHRHKQKQKQMKRHTKRKMLTFPKYHLSPVSGPLVFQLYFVPMCLVAVQILHCWCTQNSLEQGRTKICPEMENPSILEVPNSSAAPCVCVCIGLWWRFQSKKEEMLTVLRANPFPVYPDLCISETYRIPASTYCSSVSKVQ